jgi:hypothetical protein
MKKLVYALFLLAILTSCGDGDGGGSSTPAAVNATGIWYGPYSSSVFGAQNMMLNLVRNGDGLTGTYSSSTGATGSVSGSVSGTTANFTITLTTPGCGGSFEATGIIDIQPEPNTMSLQYSGSSTCGGNESGTGNLTKQAPVPIDATGTWNGPYNSTVSGAQTMTLNIQQNIAVITGTYSSSTGATGSILGSVSDNTASFTIILNTQDCSGSFVGTGIIDARSNPNTMSYQYSGSSTCGGNESGTGNLTKQ